MLQSGALLHCVVVYFWIALDNVEQLETFIKSLPKNAVEIKSSLDEEISQRINDYKNGDLQTVTFGTGLDSIREKLSAQL